MDVSPIEQEIGIPGNTGGFSSVFNKDTISFKLCKELVLKGCWNRSGLWVVEQQYNKQVSEKNKTVSRIYTLSSIATTVRHLHAADGFPKKDTWMKAIEMSNYENWPGINTKTVRKHYPDESVEAQKGCMKKQSQNIQSTKVREHEDNMTEIAEIQQTPTRHNLFVKVVHVKQTAYSDQTGHFPVQSSQVNCLVMLFYDVRSNYIDAKPMKDNKVNSLIAAYKALWTRVSGNREIKPNMHIMENKVPALFKEEIRENCILQLVPPDTHRCNLAEREIQTFKRHFISILAGIDPTFSMYLWD